MKRRSFIAAASATALSPLAAGAHTARHGPALRLLILGGTQFIGVHLTRLALERGHQVTLFNRGKSNPGLFPTVEKLRGDRNGQLDALRGHSWDAVIDDSGYVPRHVRLSAELLAPHVQRYVYVSSVSAYASFARPNDESSPLGTLRDESVEDIGGGNYGPLKALCERAAQTAMPHRVIVIRPHIVAGPDDPTDRFTYWPARASRGGPLLAPGSGTDGTQYIDVRDLARFMLDAIEYDRLGTYNVAIPPGTVTMGALVAGSIRTARALARPQPPPRAVWVSAAFLEEHKVDDDQTLPLWFPPQGEEAAIAQVSAQRALAAGLRITPLATTLHDTLQWYLQGPGAAHLALKSGLEPAREAQLLQAWHTQGA